MLIQGEIGAAAFWNRSRRNGPAAGAASPDLNSRSGPAQQRLRGGRLRFAARQLPYRFNAGRNFAADRPAT
jgi:hypothetical protein